MIRAKPPIAAASARSRLRVEQLRYRVSRVLLPGDHTSQHRARVRSFLLGKRRSRATAQTCPPVGACGMPQGVSSRRRTHPAPLFRRDRALVSVCRGVPLSSHIKGPCVNLTQFRSPQFRVELPLKTTCQGQWAERRRAASGSIGIRKKPPKGLSTSDRFTQRWSRRPGRR